MQKDLLNKDTLLIGIISDTHSLLRPEAVDVLRDSDLILHAGDIGKENILDELGVIAPVIAVRGNTDSEAWSWKLRTTEALKLNNIRICVTHDINSPDSAPSLLQADVVVNGHTHRPSVSRHKDVLFINPGSAGPKRPALPVSVALLRIEGSSLDARIFELDVTA